MDKKILTVDDSQTVRSIISKHLAQFPVRILEAENGEEGVARARAGAPDLILLDYNMPVMDGYHTLVELKTDPNLRAIPVVMVTTETSKETVVKLLKLGLNDYIAKPFTREILLKKINPILKLYNGDQVPAVPSTLQERKPEAPKAAVKQSILAIDDKTTILQLLREQMGEQFFLTTEESGRGALKALSQKNFDYVFLDLSLPDMPWSDFLDAYLKDVTDGAREKKIVAMTMRSAQAEIRRAAEAGIATFLYKPFTRTDVAGAIEQVIASQNESPSRKLRYLVAKGKTRILECPAEKSSRFRLYAEFLASEIIREIDMMIEEGLQHLVISVGEGFLSHAGVYNDFISLIKHVRSSSLSVRLVADSSDSRHALKQFSETCDLPLDVSLECALSSIAA